MRFIFNLIFNDNIIRKLFYNVEYKPVSIKFKMLNIFQKPNFPELESLIDYDIYNNVEMQRLYQSVFPNSNMRKVLPEGNNYNYKKYLILATQRTGTNLLADLLKSHSNIVSYYEIFWKENKQLGKGFKPFNDYKIYNLSVKFPVEFLKQYIFRNYSEIIEAVGFKLMYNQLSQYKINEIINMHDNSINIVHLKRRNKLRTLVSLRLTEKNNIWSQFQQEQPLFVPEIRKNISKNTKPYSIKTVKLSIKECERFFKLITKKEKIFDKMISKNPVLPLYYEDLKVNIEPEVNKLISFLNISKEKLTTHTVKQNPQPLSKSIENYYELSEYFKNTHWGIYFEE